MGKRSRRRRRPGGRAWQYIGLSALTLVVAVLVVVALRPVQPPIPDARPVSTPAPEATVEAPKVAAFLGDSYTHGIGASSLNGYARMVAADLGYAHFIDGVDGSGYLTAGTGQPIPTRVQGIIDSDPDVVIVAGGFNDNGRGYDPAEVGAAAQETLTALRAGLPDARIILVGAFPVGVPVPAGQPPIEEALGAAAAATGVEFVSPINEGWVTDWAAYISPDGLHPNDAGHRLIADRLIEYLG